MARREEDARQKALRHPTRAALHRCILQEPGVAPAALASALRLSWAMMAYHVEVLVRVGLVRRVRGRHGNVLFPAARGELARGEAMLRDRTALVLAKAIVDDPGRDLGRLAQAAQVSPCVAHLHVRRMREAGLVLAPSPRLHRDLAPSEALEHLVRRAPRGDGEP